MIIDKKTQDELTHILQRDLLELKARREGKGRKWYDYTLSGGKSSKEQPDTDPSQDASNNEQIDYINKLMIKYQNLAKSKPKMTNLLLIKNDAGTSDLLFVARYIESREETGNEDDITRLIGLYSEVLRDIKPSMTFSLLQASAFIQDTQKILLHVFDDMCTAISQDFYEDTFVTSWIKHVKKISNIYSFASNTHKNDRVKVKNAYGLALISGKWDWETFAYAIRHHHQLHCMVNQNTGTYDYISHYPIMPTEDKKKQELFDKLLFIHTDKDGHPQNFDYIIPGQTKRLREIWPTKPRDVYWFEVDVEDSNNWPLKSHARRV